MPIEVLPASGKLLRARVTGVMTLADFQALRKVAEAEIQRRGRMNALIIVEDFHGWERGADWGDLSFAIEHDKDIEKMAFVGEAKWKDDFLAFTLQPMRTTAIEFFESSRLADAEAWLNA